MKVRLKSVANAPGKENVPYFSENYEAYQLFKRGKIVDLPEYVVESLRSMVSIDESPMDGDSIIEEIEDDESADEEPADEEPANEESPSVEEEVDPALDNVEEEAVAVDFYEELVGITKIGPQKATDIMDVYSDRDELVQALDEGNVEAFPSQIVKILKDFYIGA